MNKDKTYTIKHRRYAEVIDALRSYRIPIPINDAALIEQHGSLDECFVNVKYNVASSIAMDFFEYADREITFMRRKQEFVETIVCPSHWSDIAARTFYARYCSDGEGIHDTLMRIVLWLTFNGIRSGHLNFEGYSNGIFDYRVFARDTYFALYSQRSIFNSPVFFNMGVDHPYGPSMNSGCFILHNEDTMGSIAAVNLVSRMIAVEGGGSGYSVADVRSKYDTIGNNEGSPTGPVGWMEDNDATLACTKSGGKIRRSAKLVTIPVYHPEILDFIRYKVIEEEKGQILAQHCPGWDSSISAVSQKSVVGTLKLQNINPAVMTSNYFYEAVQNDAELATLDRFGNPVGLKSISARKILHELAVAQHACADPGVQDYNNMNAWNPFYGPAGWDIRSTNACSESTLPDNTACNLSGINIYKFFTRNGDMVVDFDREAYDHTISLLVVAQDIMIDHSYYPTADIAERTYAIRNIGISLHNMGHTLYCLGYPYDSDEGRAFASAITAYHTASAYEASQKLSGFLGPYSMSENELVQKNHTRIIDQHLDILSNYKRGKRHHIDLDVGLTLNFESFFKTRHGEALPGTICDATGETIRALAIASLRKTLRIMDKGHFPRNSHVSIYVPGGTTCIIMDCNTNGIEPEMTYDPVVKNTVDGGQLVLLKVSDSEMEFAERAYLARYGSEAPLAKLYESSLGGKKYGALSLMSHAKMMAAVQPFISLGISKTCNAPADITVKEIEELFVYAHQAGIKAITTYRWGCKNNQPLQVAGADTSQKAATLEIKKPNHTISDGYNFQFGTERFFVDFKYHPEFPQYIWELWITKAGERTADLDAISILASRTLQAAIRAGTYDEALERLASSFVKIKGSTAFISFPDEHPAVFADIRGGASHMAVIGRMMRAKGSFSGIDLMTTHQENKPVETAKVTNGLSLYGTGRYCQECGSEMYKEGMSGSCYSCPNGCSGVGGCGV